MTTFFERTLLDDPAVVLELADSLGVSAFVVDGLGGDGADAVWSTNDAFQQALGQMNSVSDFIRRVHAADRDALLDAITRCERGDFDPTTQRFRMQSAFGSQAHFDVELVPVRIEDGHPRCLGTVSASDDARLTAVAERVADLQDIVSNVPGAVFRYAVGADGVDQIEYMSDGCVEIFEIDADELKEDPSPLWEMIHEEDLEDTQQSVEESAASLTPWRHEWRITPRSGRTKWLQGYGTPRQLRDGAILWHTLILNVTAQREAERAVAESLRRTVGVLSATVEARDPYTAGHQSRVTSIATAIGRELGLDHHRLEGLELAASIHDVGKIQIPAEILGKPSKLTSLEFELIKTHSEVGSALLRGIEFPWPIAEIILQHHERIDGSGYPGGLVGDEILLEARIIAVADTVEAISSHRPYRASLGLEHARSELRRLAGIQLDADAVAAAEGLLDAGALA